MLDTLLCSCLFININIKRNIIFSNKMGTSSVVFPEYKTYMLNKTTTSPSIIQYIESCAVNETVGAGHVFHKIKVSSWTDGFKDLFRSISEYYELSLIPINADKEGSVISFYTSNLNLLLKIIKLDFVMLYARKMYNITITFNEKTSVDLFGTPMTLEDIVSRVVNRRFSQQQELDLSSFTNDHEFLDWKVHFYDLSLLSHFKILMLRIAKETKSLNLSKNRLSKIPLEILNFFIKGDLISIDLSYNKIQMLSDLSRVSSKIEMLWIEGNPLCTDIEPCDYVKNIITKFPRLKELDGIKLNEYALVPMRRNYLHTPDRVTKLVVERFLILFFSLYDNKKLYRKDCSLYDDNAVFTLMTDFTEIEEKTAGQCYANMSRNILDSRKNKITKANQRLYRKPEFTSALSSMPVTLHDPHTFNVDVLHHNEQTLTLVVDGIYKEFRPNRSDLFFKFRRTFILAIYPQTEHGRLYCIMNDMFYVGFASEEQIKNSFKHPIINFSSLELVDPKKEETSALVQAFSNVTTLKKIEAEKRLKRNKWDFNAAIKEFMSHVKHDYIPHNCFVEEDDFSDTSSLLDYVD